MHEALEQRVTAMQTGENIVKWTSEQRCESVWLTDLLRVYLMEFWDFNDGIFVFQFTRSGHSAKRTLSKAQG